MSEYIVDNVRGFLQKLLPGMDLQLFDIQFRREGHGWVLRVYIDSAEGVALDQCSGVSRELSHYLDVEDLIGHAYHLEVSSPGLERPLRSVADFCRFTGEKARVKLSAAIDDEKIFEGTIEEVHGNEIGLRLEDNKLIRFSYEVINKARLAI
ncbi:MAG: ribosome maturation factor RimP [Deltaproteobacteria bacterium]|nr:ribosome maturation factor RimP [Deltaproteobacteria bacterium]MBW2658087.1 ribosome maturation factor RimP [Deltaproteobacteria bacterium]